jgi:hypothetical protein
VQVVGCCYFYIWDSKILGSFAKFRKRLLDLGHSFCPSSCPSVRLPVRMEQLGFHLTDFHEILHWVIFRQSVKKIQVSLKSDKNSEYCTWMPKYIYDNISPNTINTTCLSIIQYFFWYTIKWYIVRATCFDFY